MGVVLKTSSLGDFHYTIIYCMRVSCFLFPSIVFVNKGHVCWTFIIVILGIKKDVCARHMFIVQDSIKANEVEAYRYFLGAALYKVVYIVSPAGRGNEAH